MPRTISSDELDALVAALDDNQHGTGVAELTKRFPRIPRRSLQRRLAHLVAKGRLRAAGRGPAWRYYPASPPATGREDAPTPTAGIGEPVVENYVPTSAAGQRLRQQIRRPLSQRTPVGYRRAFLDRYVPNRTFYLPRAARARLHQLGRSPVGTRPAGTYARQILDRLLVDLSWASSRLEGNTYSRLDTQNLIEFGRYAEGKDLLEAQMILNHKAAIEMLVDGVNEVGFDRYTFENLHALLAENLLPGTATGGRLRKIDVGISGTVYQPVAIPQVIEERFDALLATAAAIDDPLEQALFTMVQMPYLQPFEDVNKRVSRLAANIPLIKRNLAPLSFVDVPEAAYIDGTLAVYELNRIELLRDVFIWAYERSCQRYTLIKQALPTPDPLRLRYREVLIGVVSGMVHAGFAPTPANLRSLAGADVAAADMPEFIALCVNELLHLHEGNIARYRLRRSEFHDWQGIAGVRSCIDTSH